MRKRRGDHDFRGDTLGRHGGTSTWPSWALVSRVCTLRRLIGRARAHGLDPKIGMEYELYLFRGDLAALAAAGWQPEPLRARPYTYGVYGGGLDEDLIQLIRRQLAAAGMQKIEPPQSLEEAVDLLERSTVAREMLGEDFVQHYVLMKRFEAEKYRQHVSAWEVRRYVEMA